MNKYHSAQISGPGTTFTYPKEKSLNPFSNLGQDLIKNSNFGFDDF
jgi:hypothetical protein